MIKLSTVMFDKKGDMYRYIAIGHSVVTLIKRVSLTRLLCSGSKQITMVFEELNTTAEMFEKNLRKTVSVEQFAMIFS